MTGNTQQAAQTDRMSESGKRTTDEALKRSKSSSQPHIPISLKSFSGNISEDTKTSVSAQMASVPEY